MVDQSQGGDNAGKSKQHADISETHPNPHGEQQVAEVPLQTDHRAVTRENVAQNPSTTENRMNPSVTGALEDPSSDSIFNLADPQTKELEKEESPSKSGRKRNRSKRRPKAA